MNGLLPVTKRFLNLIDAVEGRYGGPGYSLGPSLGDDGFQDTVTPVPSFGPSVGVDVNPPLNALGPSVGDDSTPSDSDLRLKCDVSRVGTAVCGLPLYQFKYTGHAETYEGVMAQDVLKVMPSAVSRGADGYYRVNYGLLGMEMRRIS